MLTFTLLMQLGMAIAIAQRKVRSPHRYGDGGPHIYVDLGTGYIEFGTGSSILYSYEDPIYIERGPQTYTKGSPYPTIAMGPDDGPHIYVDLGTPNLYSFRDPGSPKSGVPIFT